MATVLSQHAVSEADHEPDAPSLFFGTDAGLFERCRRSGTERTLARGERLLARAERNESVYFVLRGRLGVYLEGGQPPLVQFGPGECVGEMSVLTGARASADVIAETDTVVLVLPGAVLWTLVDRSHAVARNLLYLLVNRIRQDDEVMRCQLEHRRVLEREAASDALTGLGNRRWMERAFAAALACRGPERPAALLLIDADHFKAYNDLHGHPAGDLLLRTLARSIAVHLRPSDLAARYGGEEFVVLLMNADERAASAIAERIRGAAEALSAACEAAGLPPGVTVSIGLAPAGPTDTVESLIASADAALYRAKAAGRNRVSL
jgi:diguanylate cyclase (GGDEF)-like protein